MSATASALAPAPNVWRSRLGLAAMTVARFALAVGMMPYAISKLFNLQFEVSASSYDPEPLGAAMGTTLTWAFLGYSPAFQFHSRGICVNSFRRFFCCLPGRGGWAPCFFSRCFSTLR